MSVLGLDRESDDRARPETGPGMRRLALSWVRERPTDHFVVVQLRTHFGRWKTMGKEGTGDESTATMDRIRSAWFGRPDGRWWRSMEDRAFG